MSDATDAEVRVAADGTETPDPGVSITADELVVVEATAEGYRRRKYVATPDAEHDARLELSRWHADGWRPTGEERLDRVTVNGTAAFETSETDR